jgi:hypothetical protein
MGRIKAARTVCRTAGPRDEVELVREKLSKGPGEDKRAPCLAMSRWEAERVGGMVTDMLTLDWNDVHAVTTFFARWRGILWVEEGEPRKELLSAATDLIIEIWSALRGPTATWSRIMKAADKVRDPKSGADDRRAAVVAYIDSSRESWERISSGDEEEEWFQCFIRRLRSLAPAFGLLNYWHHGGLVYAQFEALERLECGPARSAAVLSLAVGAFGDDKKRGLKRITDDFRKAAERVEKKTGSKTRREAFANAMEAAIATAKAERREAREAVADAEYENAMEAAARATSRRS